MSPDITPAQLPPLLHLPTANRAVQRELRRLEGVLRRQSCLAQHHDLIYQLRFLLTDPVTADQIECLRHLLDLLTASPVTIVTLVRGGVLQSVHASQPATLCHFDADGFENDAHDDHGRTREEFDGALEAAQKGLYPVG